MGHIACSGLKVVQKRREEVHSFVMMVVARTLLCPEIRLESVNKLARGKLLRFDASNISIQRVF